MIVSHEHGFIFLKARKVAGSSVELGMSPLLGRDDIYAPTGAEEDPEIRREIGGVAPRNYRKPLKMVTARDVARFLVRGKLPIFHPHTTAAAVRRLVGRTTWDSYYKFTITRNPWDSVISHYWFVRKRGWLGPAGERMTVGQFLDTKFARNLAQNYRFAMIGDSIAVNRVCRYENLERDLLEVRSEAALPYFSLPRAKNASREDRRHYREILTDDVAERIAAMFPVETSRFGYRY